MKEARRKGIWSTPSWAHVSIFSNPVGILVPTISSFSSFPPPPISTKKMMRNSQFANLTYKILFKNHGYICIFMSSACLSGPDSFFFPSQFYLYMYWLITLTAVLWLTNSLIKAWLGNLESCFLSLSCYCSLVLPFSLLSGVKNLIFDSFFIFNQCSETWSFFGEK